MPATPSAREILDELRPLGTESYKRVMVRHGVKEPFFGVKIGDLKKVQRRVKQDHRLALDLFDTGVYDAMYLAGLVADPRAMRPEDLQGWLDRATSPAIAEFTVPWVAAEGPHGLALARAWIASDRDLVAVAGWNTLSGVVALTPDADLDTGELRDLLRRVTETLHDQPDRVRYAMNGFVIAVGAYVGPMFDEAVAAARRIGPVRVELVGDCKLPDAEQALAKIRDRGTLGRKRKAVRC